MLEDIEKKNIEIPNNNKTRLLVTDSIHNIINNNLIITISIITK